MPKNVAPTHGIVYIVGGGPGDPGLITVKGLECLRRAFLQPSGSAFDGYGTCNPARMPTVLSPFAASRTH